ncbi:MAG: PHP domain-containing protein [Oscillospiraceae bacterium]
MNQIFLTQDKKFFKANLHSHTTNSDGMMTPEQAKNAYIENGYSVVAFTDHNVLNYFDELNDENFLTLCGYEFDVFDTISYAGFTKTCHICAIAKKPLAQMQIQTAIKPSRYVIP